MRKPGSWVGLLVGGLLALWALVVAVPTAHAAPASALVLAEGQSAVRVTQGVDFLIEEPGRPLSAEQAWAASGWARHEGRQLNFGRQPTPVWVRLSVENRASHAWVLGVDWPLLEQIRFHQFDARTGRLVATQDAGLAVLAHRKPHDTGHAFALQLRQGGEATVLLRVHTRSAIILPLTWWEESAYTASRYSHDLTMGVLFGILAIMLLYNASLYLFTRDSSYAYYSVYLLAATLFEVASTGYGSLLVWGNNAWLNARGFELFACLTYLTGALLFLTFLELKTTRWPHLRWLKQAAVVFWSLATVLVVVHPSMGLTRVIGLVAVLGGLSAIYVSVFLTVKGNISARYFAVAWTALMVCSFIHVLSLYGRIDSNWFTDYGQHAGFVIEIVLLSVALADRIQRDRLARDRAQREALALTRSVQHEREEKIKAQEEVLALQTRANDELELHVLDRTAELERAMKNLAVVNTELSTLSMTDALTQVHNRRYFDEVLAREHDRSARTGVPLALLLVDIDHFKNINDSWGHLAGDECLRLVAATMAQTVGRSTDLVARYGGEEFALVLPGTGPEQALEVAERVRRAVAGLQFTQRGGRVPISVSIGVVVNVTQPSATVGQFIGEADAALYRAKAAGRNCVMLAA